MTFAAADAPAAVVQTRHTKIEIDEKGFITSLTDRASGKNYAPAGRPSPLLSLHQEGQGERTCASINRNSWLSPGRINSVTPNHAPFTHLFGVPSSAPPEGFQRTSFSILAASSKSLSVMPPAEWVFSFTQSLPQVIARSAW